VPTHHNTPQNHSVDDIFEKLAAPFTPEEIRERPGPRGRPIHYIKARTARCRLDAAVGPANWECRVEPSDNWVKCTLTLHLPDGRAVSREALSGYINTHSRYSWVHQGGGQGSRAGGYDASPARFYYIIEIIICQ
jgi:hypothetical protein